jgi:hypothetical protein
MLAAQPATIFRRGSISTIRAPIRVTHFRGGRSFWFGPNIFDRITDGIAMERRVKGWSRAKKEAFIRADWTNIRQLARRRAGAPKTSV